MSKFTDAEQSLICAMTEMIEKDRKSATEMFQKIEEIYNNLFLELADMNDIMNGGKQRE